MIPVTSGGRLKIVVYERQEKSHRYAINVSFFWICRDLLSLQSFRAVADPHGFRDPGSGPCFPARYGDGAGVQVSLFLRVVRGVNGRACPGMVLAQFGMANLIRAGGDVFMGILTMLLVVMGRGCRFASW